MKINLKESLNELDMLSDNRYDLYNTYLSKNPSLNTKKKLSEAIYNNKSPKEIALILKEDWDDAAWHDTADQEQVDQPDYFPDGEDEPEWEEMNSKSVRDSDGFLTDYTWYRNNETGQNVFVFGDKDLYGPEDGYFDWECDTDMEGFEWFKNYTGPGDDEDDWMNESLNESSQKFVIRVKDFPFTEFAKKGGTVSKKALNYDSGYYADLDDLLTLKARDFLTFEDEKDAYNFKNTLTDEFNLDDDDLYVTELFHLGGVILDSLNESLSLDSMKELEDNGWTVLSSGIRGGDNEHYWLARKSINGKGSWKAINNKTGEVIDISYDQALGREPINGSKEINNLSKFLGKKLLPNNESLKEDYSDYDRALEQVDEEAEEMIKRYDKGDESIFDILSDLGYVSDDPNSVYMYKEVGNGNAIVFDLEPFDDGKGYVKYFVVDDSDKIPSGYTSTRLFIDESLKEEIDNDEKEKLDFILNKYFYSLASYKLSKDGKYYLFFYKDYDNGKNHLAQRVPKNIFKKSLKDIDLYINNSNESSDFLDRKYEKELNESLKEDYTWDLYNKDRDALSKEFKSIPSKSDYRYKFALKKEKELAKKKAELTAKDKGSELISPSFVTRLIKKELGYTKYKTATTSVRGYNKVLDGQYDTDVDVLNNNMVIYCKDRKVYEDIVKLLKDNDVEVRRNLYDNESNTTITVDLYKSSGTPKANNESLNEDSSDTYKYTGRVTFDNLKDPHHDAVDKHDLYSNLLDFDIKKDTSLDSKIRKAIKKVDYDIYMDDEDDRRYNDEDDDDSYDDYDDNDGSSGSISIEIITNRSLTEKEIDKLENFYAEAGNESYFTGILDNLVLKKSIDKNTKKQLEHDCYMIVANAVKKFDETFIKPFKLYGYSNASISGGGVEKGEITGYYSFSYRYKNYNLYSGDHLIHIPVDEIYSNPEKYMNQIFNDLKDEWLREVKDVDSKSVEESLNESKNYKDLYFGEINFKLKNESDKQKAEQIMSSIFGDDELEGGKFSFRKTKSGYILKYYGNIGSIYYEKYFKEFIKKMKNLGVQIQYKPESPSKYSKSTYIMSLDDEEKVKDFLNESLDEAMVEVEPTEKELNQVINVLNKYGFKVDDNYKPGRGLFGSYHIQVINPDLDYIDFDQLVKDVEPVGDALDDISSDINMPITYNFGANDDNVITGGIDIHVGYKEDDID